MRKSLRLPFQSTECDANERQEPEIIADQAGAIVGGAMQDMDDDYLRGFDAVEDQVLP